MTPRIASAYRCPRSANVASSGARRRSTSLRSIAPRPISPLARVAALAAAGLLIALPTAVAARDIRTSDLVLPAGFKIEAAVTGLAAPTMVAFEDQGRMLIAESGYDGSGEPPWGSSSWSC